jgi:hypothetical protein
MYLKKHFEKMGTRSWLKKTTTNQFVFHGAVWVPRGAAK